MASDAVVPVLPEGAGYGVVVGIGFFFALVMAGVSWMQNKYTQYSTKTSEEFNTASRSVKPGLIASGVVSAWTWAATLLQSSTVAYEYGISGPFWVYAAGATVQIFMFSVLACKVKQNAPYCHTYLEIVYHRYGRVTHLVFIFFAMMTNILVASQLLLGGSAVVTALTGMNVYAAVFLIPLGVCVYVVLGGLRATFLCDYSHTVILMIIILYFMFTTYTSSDLIGSPTEMYELLKEASIKRPVAGNTDGSYLTLKSNYGLIFGVIQLCSGMGTVFLDQGYWQRAIASRPSSAVRAYIMGGFAWFAIPFGFSTTLGLAAVALTDNPRYPTYPNNMTTAQVSAGLSAPFAAAALLGKHGAVALLITLFMAVTSSSASELIAVSSILTFDIYKVYIKPSATPKELIFVSHVMICIFGVIMAVFACIWNAIGIDLGWLFLVMGLLIGGAVFPAAFTVTWKGQTKAGAISGAICGLIAGLTAWLAECKVYYGELNVTTTGQSYPTLAGNMAAVLTGLLVSVVVSVIKPDDFDWEITRAINAPAAGENPIIVQTGGEDPNHNHNLQTVQDEEKEMIEDEAVVDDPKRLRRAFILAVTASTVLSFIMDFLIPIPMFLSHYVFSKGFFIAWVVISFIWVFGAVALCGILPIWETRRFFKELFIEIFGISSTKPKSEKTTQESE
ncbi:Sodium:solute symporter family-domain-containing protein [Paecilomyces variotii]|uniref:Sodium:solute symporter family-domain-containing protein n=1 Tax=Byssochlamys spectabilis TaxID=264951 RepID=A0A443HY14_BYSSP|nr:Sodium:solute symporter family-domain-containing protein [Paecilomyces variotii]RWQ96725.1 Sodium:solute symporter family-domain-containing protein [Paecilomyces variotii]